MNVLIDYSGMAIGTVLSMMTGPQKEQLTVELVRHCILNNIRKFRQSYVSPGDKTIICCDASNYWRKDYFPYYKARRARNQEKQTTINWTLMFECLGVVRRELEQNFPYHVLRVERTEADDIIAVLCKYFFHNGGEKCLIVSADKDFRQLQAFDNVSQVTPFEGKYIDETSPATFLKSLIVKGDDGDDVMNILSDDDTFVTPDKRQKPMTQTRFQTLMEQPFDQLDEATKKNYLRNKKMVDLLSEIPEHIEKQIIDTYHNYKVPKGDRVMSYMIDHQLVQLMSNAQELVL